jgi:chloramphenicol-sensitive protein RarD
MLKPNYRGYYYAISAMFIWGAFPIYWNELKSVDTLEVLAHRTIWCAVFTGVVLLLQPRFKLAQLLDRSAKQWLILTFSAVLIATNWGLFIWAVQHGYVIESSLGYFLSPLISIVLGWWVFKETLKPLHWLALALASIGVVLQIIALGVTPWLGLLISASFAFYGVLRKLSSADSLTGLLIETLILTPLAVAYLFYVEFYGNGLSVLHADINISLLLLLGGVVTAIPLMLYVGATRLLSLSVVGFLFYINPTLHFLIGRFLYNEPFAEGQMLGFVFIWTGLILYTFDSFRRTTRAALT